MVATDRLSAFDVVLPTPIPGKGIILTSLSAFWFGLTSGLVPNHLLSTDTRDFPDDVASSSDILAGRTMLVRRAERIDVECVVRGYLAGSAWSEYQEHGTVAGEPMPAGLRLGDKLPTPRFTPAAKMDEGHDVNLGPGDLEAMVGREVAEQLERTSLNVFLAASELAEDRGLILADTKFEFGFIDGELTLIDELLTPDSSRYWDAAIWEPGSAPANFDKQFVRDWLAASGWDREPPGPILPDDVVAGTLERYAEVHRRFTGSEPLVEMVSRHDGPVRQGPGGSRLAEREQASRWRVEVAVVPKAGVNDPEGEAILGGLGSLGFDEVETVRAGRLYVLELTAASDEEAKTRATAMADKLLANPVIQSYTVVSAEPVRSSQ